ncbi:MAG: tRNA (adenosine(37)-N6)-threonylcarbamoyltransferase complex ATPase subunit type 1 TsaE [Candidatus Niyogibacteria bacterium]|nr:tRNA (adenosine(37)-N6)-threonylcarbamoyltransferase complex ATPase subunit type 1 TsaE [Candidatus Niyogibacteria bacterium]
MDSRTRPSARQVRFRTKSAGETQRIAGLLAKDLAAVSFHDHALVVALSGDLGGGKTTFVQGFAKGLGIRDAVQSPTFLIARNYAFTRGGYTKLIHVDAYRLGPPAGGAREIETVGWNEWVEDRHAVILVEWAKNIEKLLPKVHFDIHFEFISDTERDITIHVEGI